MAVLRWRAGTVSPWRSTRATERRSTARTIQMQMAATSTMAPIQMRVSAQWGRPGTSVAAVSIGRAG